MDQITRALALIMATKGNGSFTIDVSTNIHQVMFKHYSPSGDGYQSLKTIYAYFEGELSGVDVDRFDTVKYSSFADSVEAYINSLNQTHANEN